MKSNRHFGEMLRAGMEAGRAVCVGLDPDLDKIPERIRDRVLSIDGQLVVFCKEIINAMPKGVVLAYKLNIAFFAAYRAAGYLALEKVIAYIHLTAPEIPVILDAKRGDIGNTNEGYVREVFEWFGADAVTVSPYMGRESLSPFLDQESKGVIVLCRTSNKGSAEFQGLDVSGDSVPGGYMPLYQYVAHRVSKYWNTNGNCALVVGATYPEELSQVRQIVGDVMPILIPGIGAQGGDVEATVKAGRDSRGQGMIINSSRSIIYAPDPRAAAMELHQAIRSHINA
jgi:orotidine-5'-phosphate decarboxylase